MPEYQPEQAISKKISYRISVRVLEVLVLLLLAVVAVIPGVLHIMYRADAQVALGNAKLVRSALEMTALEAYGESRPLSDPSADGGIRKAAYENVLMVSKVPGDFCVTKMDQTGYHVKSFLYREGDFIVFCSADPISYEVLRGEKVVDTQ